MAVAGLLAVWPAAAGALTLPPGFERTTAISGLNDPMDAEIAPNGRVFIAEKGGTIKTYDDLADTTATTFADLRTEVHNFSSRGLLGLAIDPSFPASPYVYVYYTLDAPIGGIPPVFGNPGQTNDQCPGDTDDVNCIVSQRVSRLRVAGEQRDGPEQVLVNDWCQQFQYHPGGGIEFGADGYLYVTGGDGARWEIFDYGQLGHPMNPCGDPPSPVGGPMSPPTAEGGRLRAQDLRTSGDPLGLNGSLIRIDPATGAGVPGNPMFANAEPNARRMLAHGFRNPVRLAIRPGTNDVWVGDRGGGYWEELDRVPEPTDPVRNFGWPCYEGGLDANGAPYTRIRPRSDDQDLSICEDLYAAGTATSAPYWGYDHEAAAVPGEDCDIDPSSGKPIGNQIGGINFYPASGSFPSAYHNALFFADRRRNCMWAMLPGPDGIPERSRVIRFGQHLDRAIDIEVAPGGDLLYLDQADESLRRIKWEGNSSNRPPTADAKADTVTGHRPLTVTFDAGGSSDPDPGDLLIYEWDLDGDGELDDSTAKVPMHTYLAGGTYTVTLRVTDTSGATATDTLEITVGSGPVGSIDAPAAGTTWGTGEVISFSGTGTDAEDGTLPPSALDWSVVLVRCPAPPTCQETPITSVSHAAGGSFTAPDSDYPAYIDIRLTVTDSNGESQTKTRRIDPRTANVTLNSTPAGAAVSINGVDGPAPYVKPEIVGSTVTLSAPTPQAVGNTQQRFSSWSDGQARTHAITMPTASTSRTARFAPQAPGSTTLTFAPEADALVKSIPPTGNDGAFDQLRVDGDPLEQSYLRFIVDGISGKVTSAKLRLRSTENGTEEDGPELRGTSNAWNEMGITWQNKPAATTGVVAAAGPIDPAVWTEWDITSLIGADGTFSFQLASTHSDGVSFRAREYSNATSRPELVVQVANDAYGRPRGATPVRLPLVPAYARCTAAGANRVHGAPLEHPSCNPPAQESSNLTVGSPDANGRASNSSGYALIGVVTGNPATPADEADVSLTFRLSDVRNRGGLLDDYAGELQFRPTLRLTDRESAATGTGTLQDLVLPVTVPCTPTLDPLTGSDCDFATTFDALTPGVVDEGARAVWQLQGVEVRDGGADGDVDTPGSSVFARTGILVP